MISDPDHKLVIFHVYVFHFRQYTLETMLVSIHFEELVQWVKALCQKDSTDEYDTVRDLLGDLFCTGKSPLPSRREISL